MNAGLITSYIIAGILMIAIISMNNSVSNSSSELTMNQMGREKLASISEMIASDIQKIGYNRAGKTEDKIKIANDHKIKFYSNINNSTDKSVEVVTWELTSNEVSSTSNPNDYVLLRRVEDDAGNLIDETNIELGVTNFKIGYYTGYGKPVSDSLSTPVTSSLLDDIKQLYIRVKIESPEKIYQGVNSEGRYMPSVWEKRFSPPNLEKN